MERETKRQALAKSRSDAFFLDSISLKGWIGYQAEQRDEKISSPSQRFTAAAAAAGHLASSF